MQHIWRCLSVNWYLSIGTVSGWRDDDHIDGTSFHFISFHWWCVRALMAFALDHWKNTCTAYKNSFRFFSLYFRIRISRVFKEARARSLIYTAIVFPILKLFDFLFLTLRYSILNIDWMRDTLAMCETKIYTSICMWYTC